MVSNQFSTIKSAIRSRRSAQTLALTGASILTTVAIGQVTFTGIGDLPGGAVFSRAMAISPDGGYVVGSSTSANGTEAARWHAGVLEPLGDLPGGAFDSIASGVSLNGQVIVGSATTSGGSIAFRWQSGAMQSLSVPPGRTNTRGIAITPDGTVICGNSTIGDICCYSSIQACRWVNGVNSPLLDLPGSADDSAVSRSCISADGTIIVGRGRSPGSQSYQACYWLNGIVFGLPYLPSTFTNSEAYGIAPNGSVIVGMSSSVRTTQSANHGEACRWDSGVATALGDLPGGAFESAATCVSNDGMIIAGFGTTATGTEAFVWDAAHGIRRVQDVLACLGVTQVSGWTLTHASGMTPDGEWLAGEGKNPSGFSEGWLAHIPRSAPVSVQPIGGLICGSPTATLVTGALGSSPASFQWRKNSVPLSNGPTPYGSFITGANAATLQITSATSDDSGSYDSIVTNSCFAATTNPATLTICRADFSCDGQVDDADFVLFSSAYDLLVCDDPAMPANCPADLNGDELVDDSDFVLFANAYDALLCS